MQAMIHNHSALDDHQRWLRYIPFFRQLQDASPEQFDVLMSRSNIDVLSADEVPVHAGDQNHHIYFLLRGELVVNYAGVDQQPVAIHTIYAGEVFGALSILLSQQRSADVRVASSCKQAVLLTLDYRVFSHLMDFSAVQLPTKLLFYKHVVDALRWKLDVYRRQYPTNELANMHRKIKLTAAPKGSREELQVLHQQAVDMAKLLIAWNPTVVDSLKQQALATTDNYSVSA